jgi:DNA repair protein RadC
MKLHKFKAGDSAGSYIVDSPITETDILRMADQLARQRLTKGRVLSAPEQVFSHLEMLLQHYEHEVFAVLLLDTKHRLLGFHELFRGTLDEASVHPR